MHKDNKREFLHRSFLPVEGFFPVLNLIRFESYPSARACNCQAKNEILFKNGWKLSSFKAAWVHPATDFGLLHLRTSAGSFWTLGGIRP